MDKNNYVFIHDLSYHNVMGQQEFNEDKMDQINSDQHFLTRVIIKYFNRIIV